MKIHLNSQTLFLLAIIGVMAFFLFRGPDNKELNLYKENHEKQNKERDERFKRDSLNLVAAYDSILVGRNRSLDSANEEVVNQKKISKYYEKKYKQIYTVPIIVVDKQLDSLLAGHR